MGPNDDLLKSIKNWQSKFKPNTQLQKSSYYINYLCLHTYTYSFIPNEVNNYREVYQTNIGIVWAIT